MSSESQQHFWTCLTGETGLLLRFGTEIDEAVNKKVLSCLWSLDHEGYPDGVQEILPSYSSLLLHFDPLKISSQEVSEWFKKVLTDEKFHEESDPEPRLVSIPVHYGGEDDGPDLNEVAQLSGLGSPEEVIRLHSEGVYRVFFLGFVGGFPYLGGLKAPLTLLPRRSTPRKKVPSGSVGIAGGQTGIYPISSPGGWHLLGRTPLSLFDPANNPPTLLHPGDLIKFVPAKELVPEEGRSSDSSLIHPGDVSSPPSPKPSIVSPHSSKPWIKIISPGLMTSVQDLGRFGFARYGVSRTGAADQLSLRMGNILLGNKENAAGLEVVMGGVKFLCNEPCAITLTGADCEAKLHRMGQTPSSLQVNEVIFLKGGDHVEFGYSKDGMRTYVCVQGGVCVPFVLGSCSTDLRGKLGGYSGRPLLQGDELERFVDERPIDVKVRYAMHDPLREELSGQEKKNWKIRVLPGPGDPADGAFAGTVPRDLQTLAQWEFDVLQKSDRMAVCLSPATMAGEEEKEETISGGQQISEGCVSGTIQVPPDGNPLILLAEHQTTGGYKVPGIVIKADLWKVGQMRPGDRVSFLPTTDEEAVEALRQIYMKARETSVVHPSRFEKFKLVPRNGDCLRNIDLNADAGEGFDDAGLLKYVTSVNIACGGHVGTPESVARTVALAAKAGAGIGAHPSFVDKEGFGRRPLETPPHELRDQILWQVSGLQAICRMYGTQVSYIKPHGALYHKVLKGGPQGEAVLEVAEFLQLPLLLMPHSPLASYGEGFAERAYDGENLRPRDKPGAVIHDPEIAAQQAVMLAAKGNVHSICVHGDSPNAVTVAKAVREALDKKFEVSPFVTFPSPPRENPALSKKMDWFRNPAKFKTKKPVDRQEMADHSLQTILEDRVSPIIVNGYRTGLGVEPELYPVDRICKKIESLFAKLSEEKLPQTGFSKFVSGEATYEEYIAALRAQLAQQGGGWVTVAPRDTCQQGNDSESASITRLSCMNTEMWGVKAGCVGYETGGAQYQAGLIRGFDPSAILTLGLPSNLPAHSLQRSQYVNGLTELTPEIRQALFDSTAQVVADHYQYRTRVNKRSTGDNLVPWFPYNFHAGNFYDQATDYSPQDETTAEMLQAGCTPIPVWVFSAKFSMEALSQWTARQIELFQKAKRTLHCVRIKNPGQGKDWTVKNVWSHAKTMVDVFESKGLQPPIIYIHNHDFNGMGAHIGAEVFRLAHAEGFSNLIIDAGYRKNGTHNDSMVLLSVLNLTDEQREALVEWNHNQQEIERILCRFNSRDSQMTPWDSDWAGGTEGSDIRIAKEYALDVRKINTAKEIASEVFPLERAVTPFSEYKLRLGIGIMIEKGIEPKSADAVREWVNRGGKLKVGGDVLVGLKRWETLAPKTTEVGKLLENMSEELEAALARKSNLIRPENLPADFSPAQRLVALGFQAKGLDFVTKIQNKEPSDLSSLLLAPHVLHREPKTLPSETQFKVLVNPSTPAKEAISVTFGGFSFSDGGDLFLTFRHGKNDLEKIISVQMELGADEGENSGNRRKAHEQDEIGSEVPGELVCYSVSVGGVLRAGEKLCVMESMKMEYVLSVPDRFVGRVVKSLPLKERSKSQPGEIVKHGDLLLELQPVGK